jgi:hypothetical protein
MRHKHTGSLDEIEIFQMTGMGLMKIDVPHFNKNFGVH